MNQVDGAEFALSGEAGSGNLWPTAQQELVLKAAIGDESEALEAFHAWRQTIDLDDDFDRGTFRLLPLLYQNLNRFGVRDPIMGRLKGMYRRTWYNTHRLFHDVGPAIAELESAGIKTLLLKGAPLVLTYYQNHGVRPMSDIDVVVPYADAKRAIDLLEGLGWRGDHTSATVDLLYSHAVQFNNDADGEFDLHWHVLFEASTESATRSFWESAREIEFQGIPSLQLDPTAMLLHVILHGVRWNPEPPIRWIPDAMAIMNSAGNEIDWQRIVSFASDHKLTHRVDLALHYLAERHAASIPHHVLNGLAASKAGLMERVDSAATLREVGEGRTWANAAVVFADYWRHNRANGVFRFLFGFPHYLRYRWGLNRRRQTILVILKSISRPFRRGRREPQDAPS